MFLTSPASTGEGFLARREGREGLLLRDLTLPRPAERSKVDLGDRSVFRSEDLRSAFRTDESPNFRLEVPSIGWSNKGG